MNVKCHVSDFMLIDRDLHSLLQNISEHGCCLKFIMKKYSDIICQWIADLLLIPDSRNSKGDMICQRDHAPVLLPWLIVAVVFSVGATWLAILPGSFYGIQVIRMTYKSGKIGFAEAVVHTVFQFFFLFDVLDAMYLATEKWGRGKKSSVIIGCVYLFAVFATIYLIIKMKSMF